MFKLLKLVIYVGLLLGFIWFGMTVPLGKRTLFGHVERIWKSEETQDLVEGTKETAKPAIEKIKKEAGPTVEKIKRGVQAGLDEARRPDATPEPRDRDRDRTETP